jgi:hemolysin activation/secretion protein
LLKRELKITVCLVGIFFPMASFSQVQRFPGVVDKPIPEVQIPKSHSLDAPKGAPLEKNPEIKAVDNAKQIIATLKSVQFTGNTVISSDTLQKTIASHLDKSLTKGDLAELKYEVKKAYYDRGYILVRVVTEPQDFANGVLKVSIYEAKIGEVIVGQNNVLTPWVANGMAGSNNKHGDIIQESNVETMISNLNDLSNVKANVNLRPGKQLSETDLFVTLDEAKENNNSIGVNNYGSPLTGRVITSAHVENGNLLKLGEKLSADVHRSNDDLWDVGVNASIPTGISDITFDAAYLHSENEISGRLEALKASGQSDVFSLALSDKFLNTRNHQASLSFGYENRVHESFLSDVTDTKDNLRKLFAEGSYLYRANSAVYYGSLKLSKGIDAFGASTQGEPSATRAAGNQEAVIAEPTLVANIRPFSDNGTLKALIRAQVASNTLLSSDLFAIGGYGSVRGFDVSQEVAEDGYSFTLEYNHILPLNFNKVEFKAGPFLDGAGLHNRVEGSIQDTHLYSAGFGFEANADIVPVGETIVRMDWAHPIGDYTSTTVSSDTFYVNLKQKF